MFDTNRVNKKSTDHGVWAEFYGGEFLIAHTSNIDFQREFNRLQQPYRKQIDRNKLDPKTSKELLCKAMAGHLLLDWKNVGSGDELIEYSDRVAYEVLMNNEDLRDFIQEFAMDLDNYRSESIEEAGKS